jgi:GMP synthase-like glutamine amidotransferase
MRFFCLQHVPFETPGIISGVLEDKGHSLKCIHLYSGEPLPSENEFEGLVIMGGPMSINDEREFPWLTGEKKLISAAIRTGKKVFGICLGAQLIADVLGARVYPNPQKEIGFWPVRWTEVAFQYYPELHRFEGLPVFHWHGETFDLPIGAELLASSDPCINQAFRFGDHVAGVQFHPEVTADIIRDMVIHEGHELIPAPYIQTASEILLQLSSHSGSPIVLTGPAKGPLHSDWLVSALFDTFITA